MDAVDANVKRLIEVRSYKLKAGTAAEFHDIVASTVVPMLRDSGMDVVSFGPSPNEPDCYYLVRAYDDLEHLEAQQGAFYGSDPWRNGPRTPVLSRIERLLSTVLWLTPESIEDMRRLNAPTKA